MKDVRPVFVLLAMLGPAWTTPHDKLKESIARGEGIYRDFCIQCHMAVGEGVPGVFPPLAQADYLLSNREASIQAVKYGQQGPIVVNGVSYNSVMPPPYLDNDEIADVLNYILNSWGNTGEYVSPEEVALAGQ